MRSKALVIFLREEGRSLNHIENMKAVTSGGLGPNSNFIFIIFPQSAFLQAHIRAFRANPQRTGDKSLYPGVSQVSSDQHKATGTLMPSNLETKNAKCFPVYNSTRKGSPSKDAQ